MRNVNENPAFKVLAIQNSKLLEVRFNFTSTTIASCSFTLQNTSEHMQFLLSDSEWGLKLLHATDMSQNTLLHDAARRGDLQSVEVLLHHGCSALAENEEGKLPIHLAAEHGYYK